jgi:mono/diheme cytochrome c family protein
MRHPRTLILLALGAFVAAAAARPPSADMPMPGDYRIEAGRVDRGTYNGWRLFHSACHTCHGVGGVGTKVAPNLLERIPTLTPRDFASKVLTSYRLVSPAEDESSRQGTLEEILKRDRQSVRGQVVMPAWGDDGGVSPHVLDLYAYLSARAAGELGPDKPIPMPAPAKRR